jgi:hypothetical protein
MSGDLMIASSSKQGWAKARSAVPTSAPAQTASQPWARFTTPTLRSLLSHSAALAGGSAMVSTLDRSSLRDARSISRPTTLPSASKSTTKPSTISRVSAPGAFASSIETIGLRVVVQLHGTSSRKLRLEQIVGRISRRRNPPPRLNKWWNTLRYSTLRAGQPAVANTETYPLTTSPFQLHNASSRSLKRTPAGDTGWRSESGSRGRRLVTSAPGRLGHHACRHYDRHARCIAASGAGAGGEIPRRLSARSPAKRGPTLSLGDE